MSNTNKKNQSPLVQSVLALDEHFGELERLGNKINSLDMKSEFDFEHAQRLMNRFAECGEGVSVEISSLATHLGEARERAEAMAKGISARVDLITARKGEKQAKIDKFNALSEKVRELSVLLSQMRRPQGEIYSDEERAKITMSLSQIELQLGPLILEAQAFRKEARESKMKLLEQNADSLTATLQTIEQRLGALNLRAESNPQ